MELYSLAKIRKLIKEVDQNPLKFWWENRNIIKWIQEPKEVAEGSPPKIRWYIGGLSNICWNAIDLNLEDNKNKVAFYYMNESGLTKAITYWDLFYEVNRASYFLRELGVKKGDTVSLLLPNIPEAIYFALAIYRLGAVIAMHYLGLSPQAFAERLNDSGSKILVTASKGFRNGNEIRIKDYVDKVLNDYKTTVEKVVVVSRGYSDFDVVKNRDVIYEDDSPKGKVYVEPQPIESNDPLIIAYTSGTTGKPKGIYASLAYIVASTWALKSVFGFHEGEDTVWIISDLGWLTWGGNIHFIPQKRLTGIIFEGFIGYRRDLFAKIVERFNVNLVWMPTTLLNMLKGLGEESVRGDISSLRLILNTGEPLNPGTWKWLRENMPDVIIADSYWMTEYGFPIASTPFGLGEIPYKPGSAGLKFFGVNVVDDDGKPLPPDQKGYIVLSMLNPAMGRLWNDPNMERFIKIYTSRFPNYVYTGDYGFYDEDGYLYVLGRADDIIVTGGNRVGTLEIEGILVSNPNIAEAAVVGYTKEGKNKISAFIVLKPGSVMSKEDVVKYLSERGFSVDDIFFVRRLPKTKSAKIMRRLLRSLLVDEPLGDISALDDVNVINELKEVIKNE
ncbi:AMP-dependent synthetase [Sulfolobus sp. A20]|uniref:AMP-binding protein n=1 Tax=Sulfolobaceae TaxID=118883 RepID=UPI0008461B41|nr:MULTISPECIES: AMP-binding protein [unclassified Sulfolobus]TRM85461.1 AMP-dependent synthetase [Sulfolobus sp. F3]TRM89521.1 AMP-dependent synthetase [Sulfolobus sp. C3]TRM99709.1 AMP-dependent synthetase [Sulfolobus sp. E1]AOL17417.1 AMP-dependent synthetase [Sulfolobus sp. A20]TRM98166.1 AMP-dependent synthetase [Sulfolobus sp. B1]